MTTTSESVVPLPVPAEPSIARPVFAALEQITVGRLDLITPDGRIRCFGSSNVGPHALLRVHDWSVFTDLSRAGDVGLADAYIAGKWDSPELTALLMLGASNRTILEGIVRGRISGGIRRRLQRLWPRIHRMEAGRSPPASYRHDDDFVARWLDATMSCSAALFEGQSGRSLEDAQIAKYEHILQALNVGPGDRILEIGSAWGGFAEHAVRTRRCDVRGVAFSESQRRFAETRLAKAGLPAHAGFVRGDFRAIRGKFDFIVSIEAFEQLGERAWRDFFRTVRDRLRPGGRAFVQTVTIDDVRFPGYRLGHDFVREHVLPGGLLASPSVFRKHAFRNGLVAG
ncbi:MAG: class I SAM-dependent methyltransferase, partial [Burkholderiales bacterium]|nr:class I SAM-dependent methyltransferase [Burkholderiales bacterium]